MGNSVSTYTPFMACLKSQHDKYTPVLFEDWLLENKRGEKDIYRAFNRSLGIQRHLYLPPSNFLDMDHFTYHVLLIVSFNFLMWMSENPWIKEDCINYIYYKFNSSLNLIKTVPSALQTMSNISSISPLQLNVFMWIL